MLAVHFNHLSAIFCTEVMCTLYMVLFYGKVGDRQIIIFQFCNHSSLSFTRW